jgi:hypothetical protein
MRVNCEVRKISNDEKFPEKFFGGKTNCGNDLRQTEQKRPKRRLDNVKKGNIIN